MASKSSLNPKQLAFVREYTKDFNGTQAAIRAGYSKKTAQEQSSQLLSKLIIQEAVQAKLTKKNSEDDLLRAKVKQQLAHIAFAKLTDFGTIGPSGFEVADFSNLDPMLQSVVREFSVSESNSGINARIKLSSQEKGLELLARSLGMMSDKLDIQIQPKPAVIKMLNGDEILLGVGKKDEEE